MVRMGVKMKDSHWIYQEQDELLRVNPRSQLEVAACRSLTLATIQARRETIQT
jgi:hypothetical protein